MKPTEEELERIDPILLASLWRTGVFNAPRVEEDAMRKQTQNLKKLAKEFQNLKAELFGEDKFVVLPESPQTDRYNQLLGLFYPQFRSNQWRRP